VDDIDEITNLIRRADEEARLLARGLVPVEVASNGLATALDRLSRNSERLFGINCHFEVAGSADLTNNIVATHLFRIAQEAVSNAVKHGGASAIRIHLAGGTDQIRLRVQDDGCGFPDDAAVISSGMGVRIMQYRARMIGGTLEISDGVDRGTVVTCTLPNNNTVVE
jgi:signal transduction histidine kinase